MELEYYDVRLYTNNLLNKIDEGELDAEEVLKELLSHISEDDVKEFAIDREYLDDVEDGREKSYSLDSIAVFKKQNSQMDEDEFDELEQKIQSFLPMSFEIYFDDYFGNDDYAIKNELESKFVDWLEWEEDIDLNELGVYVCVSDYDWSED